VPSRFKQSRTIRQFYRFAGFKIKELNNDVGAFLCTMFCKPPKQQFIITSKVDESSGLQVTMMSNLDVKVDILLDYVSEFVYENVYQWKWYFIYITAFLTFSVLIFVLTLIYINVVKPIIELTHTIDTHAKHSCAAKAKKPKK
jgi:hypothetical protein